MPNCDFSFQRESTIDRQTENQGLAVFLWTNPVLCHIIINIMLVYILLLKLSTIIHFYIYNFLSLTL